jgi:hypothetical protein
MMRTLVVGAALVLCATAAQAQRFFVTPIAGGTSPLAGELTMYVPVAATVGFDSIPRRYEYQAGTSFGALLEWRRASRLDFAVLATVNLSERSVSDPSGPQDCDVCGSTIIGLGFLANSQFKLGARTELAVGAGPELLFYGGDATSTSETAAPPTAVYIDPTLSIGLIAAAGLGYEIRAGHSFRVLLGYRHFRPSYVGAPDPFGPTRFTRTMIHQLLWTVGYTFPVG